MDSIPKKWRGTGCVVALILLALALPAQEYRFKRPPYRIPPPPPAGGTQLVYAELGFTNTTANGSSYDTLQSYTPTANALVIAIVMTSDTVIPVTPTFTGNGLTWIVIGSTNSNTLTTQLNKITAFRAMGASPTATVGTAAFSAAVTGCMIYVCEFRNADVTCQGSDAIVQVAFNGGDASANPVVTLAALAGGGNNAVLGASGHDINPSGTAEGSWTEDRDATYATPTTGLYVSHRTNTTDNTWGPTIGSSDWSAIAFEIMPDNGATHGCPPVSPLLTETFEGASYSAAGWSEYTGGGTVDENYQTAPIAGADSLRLLKNGASDDCYAYNNYGPVNESWAYCRVEIVDLTATEFSFFRIYDGIHVDLQAHVVIEPDGQLRVVCGTANATTTDSVAEGSTYHVWLHYDANAAGTSVADVGFSTDGVRPTSGNKFASLSTGSVFEDGGYVELSLRSSAAEAPEIKLDTLYVDDEVIGDQ